MTMRAYAEHMRRARPLTLGATQCKIAWDLWFRQLDWYEQNVGSKKTLKTAQDRILAFETLNGKTGPFGAEGSTIHLGSSGADVTRWQRAIGIKPTGVFDTDTQEATRSYQRRKGLPADGIVGPNTWGSLPGPLIRLPSQSTIKRVFLVLGATAVGATLAFFI